jgi:tetratricopeptide (TPR) repeat protein
VAINNLAVVAFGLGDTGASLQYLDRALQILEKEFGEDDPRLAETVDNFITALEEEGRHEEAEKQRARLRRLQARIEEDPETP